MVSDRGSCFLNYKPRINGSCNDHNFKTRAFMKYLNLNFYICGTAIFAINSCQAGFSQLPVLLQQYSTLECDRSFHYHNSHTKLVMNSAIIDVNGPNEYEGEKMGNTIVKNLVPDIQRIVGDKNYDEYVSEDDRLCVILFTASWCKNCQKLKVKYENKLAREVGDLIKYSADGVVRKGKVRFAEVEYTENKDLCAEQGVAKVPFVRFYKSGQLLTEFECPHTNFQFLVNEIEQFY